MSLFIMFIVGAVLLGAGSMWAQAWRTAQPRIGLAATLALALVTGGAVFWAFLSGWDTLIVDYLLFALVSIVVLGGTLSQAQTRAESQGETLDDKEQGWTGPEDLLFFGLVATLFIIPIFILSLPLGTTGITLGYHTLALRLSGQFDTLAPFHAEIGLFQPPGFVALTAYLSTQLGLSIATVQFSVAGVVAFLCVWLAYDWGSELHDKRLGRAFALVCLGSGGLFILLFTGQYTTLLATAFFLAFMLYSTRLFLHRSWWDVVAGGLLFGATIYADFAVGMIAGVALLVQAGVFWGIKKQFSQQALLMVLAMLGVTLVGLAPWLVKNLGSSNAIFYTEASTLWGWLIIPITFGGGYFASVYERIALPIRQHLRQRAYVYMVAVYVVVLLILVPLVLTLREQVSATSDDEIVLDWANKNLPPEAKLLNYSTNDWASVISQRATLVIPMVANYQNADGLAVQNAQPALVWENATASQDILREYGITHVYKPTVAPDITAEYLALVFEQGEAKLYAVK